MRYIPVGQVAVEERAAAVQGLPTAALSSPGWTRRKPIPVAVQRTFLLFVATIPFDRIQGPGPLSPIKIAGALFLGCCLWYPKTCFRRPAPAVLWFSGYLAILLFMGLFVPAELRGQVLGRFLTLAQFVVLFWLGTSLLQDIRLARQVLFTFGAASAVLAIGAIVRLPGFGAASEVRSGMRGVEGLRANALGYNPNRLATVMAVAAVMLIGLLLDNTRRTRGRAWLLACLTAPLLVLLVGTSSRGGLMSFVFGASLFLVPLFPSRRRFAAFALGSFALIALGVMLSRDPMSVARWTDTIQEGAISGRDVIWKHGAQMFLERPILGWGPIECLYELGFRNDMWTRDPQNLLLWLLLEVGIVGTLCFGAGFWLCVRAAWKSRAGPEGILPLALMVVIAVKNFSGVGLDSRAMWLVLAVALASPVVRAEWQRAVSFSNRRAPGNR